MAGPSEEHVQERQSDGESAERAPDRGSYENQKTSDIPILEWIIGAAGLVIVAGVIAFLFYHAVTSSQSPPDVSAEVTSVMRIRSGYLVTVKTSNHGGSTAAAVVIQGELRKGSDVLEQSHVTLDYSPPNSANQVGLFFTRDPRQFDLQVRALGYVEP